MLGRPNSWLTEARIIIAPAQNSTGRTTRRVETPADNSGNSSLFRCIHATVNMPASSTTDSHSLSKI